MEDWKSALGAMLASGELPEGDAETPAAPEEAGKGNGAAPRKGRLTIAKEKKGRAGKTALIVEGFTESDEEIAELAAWLKKRLGTGGSSRGGEILIQGYDATKLASLLREKGYKVAGY